MSQPTNRVAESAGMASASSTAGPSRQPIGTHLSNNPPHMPPPTAGQPAASVLVPVGRSDHARTDINNNDRSLELFRPLSFNPNQDQKKDEADFASYCRKYGFTGVFLDRTGTEIERYGSVIERTRAKNEEKNLLPLFVAAVNRLPKRVVPKTSTEQPSNLSQVPYGVEIDMMRAIDYLRKSIEDRPAILSHHERRYPSTTTHRRVYITGGRVEVKILANGEDRYMGHVPGQNIFRVFDRQEATPQELADIPSLVTAHMLKNFRPDDGERLKYEGIVPFSKREYRQRFEETVFPDFMSMIIAALCFDPGRDEALTSFLKESQMILTRRRWQNPADALAQKPLAEQRADMKERIEELWTIWRIKYGHYPCNLPSPIRKSLRHHRIAEVAWLMEKFEDDRDNDSSYLSSASEVWKACTGFFCAITNFHRERLVSIYSQQVQRHEALAQLQDSKRHSSILFYCSSTRPPNQDIHDGIDDRLDHFEPGPLWVKRLRALAAVANKILKLPPAPAPAPAPAPPPAPAPAPRQVSQQKQESVGDARYPAAAVRDTVVVGGSEESNRKEPPVANEDNGSGVATEQKLPDRAPAKKRKRGPSTGPTTTTTKPAPAERPAQEQEQERRVQTRSLRSAARPTTKH